MTNAAPKTGSSEAARFGRYQSALLSLKKFYRYTVDVIEPFYTISDNGLDVGLIAGKVKTRL